MKENKPLIEMIYWQIGRIQGVSELFIGQLPQPIRDGLWDQPILFSDELYQGLKILSQDLVTHTEKFDQILSELSTQMQAMPEPELLLCDRVLQSYVEFRADICEYLSKCNFYLQEKNKVVDLSTLYQESQKFCRSAELFSEKTREILKQE